MNRFQNVRATNTKPQIRPGIKKAVKTVGRVASAPFKWAGKQIEKELRMQDEQDAINKEKSRLLNDWHK